MEKKHDDTTKQRKPKTKLIHIRIDEDELAQLDSLAHDVGLSRSQVIRLAVSSSVESHKKKVVYIDPKQATIIHNNVVTIGNVLVSVRDQLRRIGVNVNQIAKSLNERDFSVLKKNGIIVDRDEIDMLIKRVERASERLGGDFKCIQE